MLIPAPKLFKKLHIQLAFPPLLVFKTMSLDLVFLATPKTRVDSLAKKKKKDDFNPNQRRFKSGK